jgi:signal transduction histidine kinase
VGSLLVLRDVTEEYQLDQARELITETLVHDLRAPAGSVAASLTIIKDYLPFENDSIAVQSLGIAERSIQRVLNLINSLLDIARLDSDSVQLERTWVSLPRLAADLVDELAPVANEDSIVLTSQAQPGVPGVYADQGLLARTLANLVDNALKFTPQGGQVVVRIRVPEEGWLQVEVQDSGVGIPAEYQKKIFERFSQVPGQVSRRRGSGLGLTFCRLAVEAHGGRIWVESQPGEGSTFLFTLPVQPFEHA